MAYTSRLTYETIKFADTNTATSYVAVGSALQHAASIVKMVNLSNKNLIVSIDGTNDHDICPSGGFFLYDVTSDSSNVASIFMPAGTKYFVKTSDGAAGTGLVYLVVQYIVTV